MNIDAPLFTLAMTATESNPDILSALGINWTSLILQGIAFLLLVVLLGKFAFPVIIKSIDRRQEQLDAGLKASEAASAKAAEAEARIAEQLKQARVEADAIVATAHKEAGDMVVAAENRAVARAEHIVAEAKAGIETDVAAARTALAQEARQLVVAATETIIGEKLDPKRDNALIEAALKPVSSRGANR